MNPIENQKPPTDSPDETGLPLPRRWWQLYLLVLAWFICVVILLTLFTWTFTRTAP